jgi:two-component system, sensor histidine kinase
MPTSNELTQLQFEIAMSIGNSLDLQQMLKSALGTVLRKLNCISATLYLTQPRQDGGVKLEQIYALPRTAAASAPQLEALARIPDLGDAAVWNSFVGQLPMVGEHDGSYYHICPMSDCGLLILVCREEALASVVLKALQPLLVKLSAAYRACEQNEALKQTNQQLEATTLRLTQLISNLHAGILVEDEHRRIALVNEQFCQIFGIPVDPSQLVGMDCSQAAQDSAPLFADPVRFVDRVDDILSERGIVTQEEIKLANGSVYERDYIPIFGAESYLGHMWLYRDISERKRMEETLSAVLNTVGEGIVTVNSTGQIVMINQEVERIFGYRSQELMGQSLQPLMPEKYRPIHQAGMERYMATGDAHVLGKRLELEGLRRSGEIFPLEIFINETKIGDQRLSTASMRDITRRKEYDRMRDDFVSTVSHELRTPLASIMGWTETLLGEVPGPLNEAQRRFLGISYESAQRLNSLIEEILTVSRVQQGTLRLHHERFHPAAVFATIQKMMDGLADRKEINLIYQEDLPEQVTAIGDPRRCEQVLENLISNALKFSEAGSAVVVTSSIVEDQWHVQVSDQGMGVPEAEIPKLFERFYRATNAHGAQIQGTGLGLYVCKAIVEGHGGQIHFASREGEGTTASFTIPLELGI